MGQNLNLMTFDNLKYFSPSIAVQLIILFPCYIISNMLVVNALYSCKYPINAMILFDNFEFIIEFGVIILNPPDDLLPDKIMSLSVSVKLYSS